MPIFALLQVAAAHWSRVYSDSPALETGVAFAHVGGLLLAGGCALAADRATLRHWRAAPVLRQLHLQELHAVHRPVLTGLAVTVVSGLLLLLADLEKLLPSPAFWLKMGLVLLLLANGAWMTREETLLRLGRPASPEAADRAWRRLRASALSSLALWFLIVLAGTWLVNAA